MPKRGWETGTVPASVDPRDPGADRVPGLLGNLELDRSLGLLLHDDRTGGDPTALDDIVDAQPDQIAATQLAVDGQVEQGKVA